MSTNQNVTIPGDQTLVLTPNTGIQLSREPDNMAFAFHDPFTGRTNFLSESTDNQTLKLKGYDLSGQCIVQNATKIQSGWNQFSLSIAKGWNLLGEPFNCLRNGRI